MAEGVHSGIKRTKSCRRKRTNFQKGHLLLLKAVSSRNNWPIARITETYPNKHWRLGDVVSADQRELARPITKIVLLVESDSLTKNVDNIAKVPGYIGGAR